MLNLVKELCDFNATSSDESSLAKIIKSKINEFCDSVTIDKLGNVIAFKKGKTKPKNKIMLSCHMDEVGFIISHIEDDGKLRFLPIGGIDPKVMPGKVLEIGQNKIKGVVNIKPIHLCSAAERSKVLSFEDMKLDIGAKSKEEVEGLIQCGDFAYFITKSECFGDEFLVAKALDDRLGCAILIDMIKEEIEKDLYFCFATREEIGCIGAGTAAFSVNPDIAIIIECTTAFDNFDSGDMGAVCKLGQGTVIPFMDKGAVYDKNLYKKAFLTAKEKKIKAQTKTGVYGANDSSSIQKAADGCKVLALCVAGRNLHSQNIIVNKKDIISTKELAKSLLQNII